MKKYTVTIYCPDPFYVYDVNWFDLRKIRRIFRNKNNGQITIDDNRETVISIRGKDWKWYTYEEVKE